MLLPIISQVVVMRKIRAVELIPKRAGEECIQQILKKNADAHKLIKYCNL